VLSPAPTFDAASAKYLWRLVISVLNFDFTRPSTIMMQDCSNVFSKPGSVAVMMS